MNVCDHRESPEGKPTDQESVTHKDGKVTFTVPSIFNAPDPETAQTCLDKAVNKYSTLAPKLADWMEVNIPEGFTVFAFPRAHQRRLRISNYLERLSQEIKRRTRVVRVFPNEHSCLRLISAVLIEIGEEREYGRLYLEMKSG